MANNYFFTLLGNRKIKDSYRIQIILTIVSNSIYSISLCLSQLSRNTLFYCTTCFALKAPCVLFLQYRLNWQYVYLHPLVMRTFIKHLSILVQTAAGHKRTFQQLYIHLSNVGMQFLLSCLRCHPSIQNETTTGLPHNHHL